MLVKIRSSGCLVAMPFWKKTISENKGDLTLHDFSNPLASLFFHNLTWNLLAILYSFSDQTCGIKIPFAFKSPLILHQKNIYAMECNHQMKNPLIKFGQRVKFFLSFIHDSSSVLQNWVTCHSAVAAKHWNPRQ